MRRVVIGAAVAALVLGAQAPVSAAATCPTYRRVVIRNSVTQTVKIHLVKVPCPGSSSPGGSSGGGGKGRSAPPDPCAEYLLTPQPPKSDPLWQGHTDGSIWVVPCYLIPQYGNGYQWRPPGAVQPTVTPAQLAQQALAAIQLPSPVIGLSPGNNSDAGMPYTWVNLWTYYWTSPASWRPLSKTVVLGAVSATATVTPMKLVFDPGDGSDASQVPPCTGPGRPWTGADGDSAPSGGACGYRYRSVSEAVTSTLSIRWTVTWTGTGGAAGQLPDMTTQAVTRFKVEQIQSVSR